MTDRIEKITEMTVGSLHDFYSTYHPPVPKSFDEKFMSMLGCTRETLFLEQRVYASFQAADLSGALQVHFEAVPGEHHIEGVDPGYSTGDLGAIFRDAHAMPLVWSRVVVGLKEERSILKNAVLYSLPPTGKPAYVIVVLTGNETFGGKGITVGFLAKSGPESPAEAQRLFAGLDQWITTNSIYRGKVLRPMFDRYGRTVNGFEFLDFPAVEKDHIILNEETWQSIDLNIFQFYERRDLFRQSGISLKRGILLAGEPGTGKTLLCKHIAHRYRGYTTIYVSAVEIEHIGSIVHAAKGLAPALLILEDIDLHAGERTRNQAKAILGELMNQMDGFASADDLFFLCTTNHLEGLEPAIVARPGRIDQILEIPKPNDLLRRKLFDLYTKDLRMKADVDSWVRKTGGLSPAAIHELVKKAGSSSALGRSRTGDRVTIDDNHMQTAWREVRDQLRKIQARRKPSSRKRAK